MTNRQRSQAEHKFRVYLKQYHPEKYKQLLAMETEEETVTLIAPT